jgi:hypothetical protein
MKRIHFSVFRKIILSRQGLSKFVIQGGVGTEVCYNRFFQESKRLWKMVMVRLSECVRTEYGQGTV